MDNPKIRIESDGITTKVYLDGKKIRCTSIDFHGDVDNGLHIKWDGTFLKEDANGVVYTLNDEIATEEFHYDSNEKVED